MTVETRREDNRETGAPRVALRWALFATLLLAIILVPFGLFGEQFDAWSTAFMTRTRAQDSLARALIFGLLAVDIVLPVPSSIVSTFAGVSLGFWDGLLTSAAGMSAGCVIGYVIGKHLGRAATIRLVGNTELQRVESSMEKWGDWIVVGMRPVPVLAEASALVAGVSRMTFARFFVMTLLANLGVSAVYAATGALAVSRSSFLLAFAGALFVPGVVLLVQRALLRRTAPPS